MFIFIAAFAIAASVAVSPVTDLRTPSDTAEMLPAPNAYVLCSGDRCIKPTPKVRKVVLMRQPAAPVAQPDPASKQSQSYGKIYDYINNQQAKQVPAAAAKPLPSAPEAGKPLGQGGKVVNADPEVVVKDAFTQTVHFELDSSVLSTAEKLKLTAWLNKVSAEAYDVRGYTCARGSEAHNQILSEQRAEAVRQFIQSKDKNAKVTAEGLGMGHYVSDKPALKRRAEIRTRIEAPPVR